jgi:putative membrane protein
MRVEELFDPEAFEAVERAVQEAERRTSGEIVPVVVARSSQYGGARATGAALVAFAAGIGVLTAPLDPWLWLPPAQVAGFVLGWLALGWPPALRRLLPSRIAAERVDRAARLAFLEHGLHETRDRTGILLYVSLLEHRVEVLADRGIDRVVEDGTWEDVVRHLVDAIRRRRADEGLIEAIRTCGELLAARFPPRPDDVDELSNRLRTDGS